jgi:Concanavalin A-like lectin/glucanases superfamily
MGSPRATLTDRARGRSAAALALAIAAAVVGATSPPASAEAVERPSERPVSLWRLGETSGTTAHDAAGRHDGGYVGGVRLGQAPAPGRGSNGSARFDGVDDFVSFGDAFDHAGRRSFSVEGWIRPAAFRASGRRIVLAKVTRGSRRAGYVLSIARARGLRGGRLRFERRGRGGVDAVVGATRLRSGHWHHTALTYDGRTLRLYVAGRLDRAAVSRVSLPDTSAPLRIGASSPGTSPFAGLLDDFAVYSRPLSPAEIRRHRRDGVPDPAGGPPALGPGAEGTEAPNVSAAPAGTARAATRPPGAPVLGDAEAAAQVRRSPWEPRPLNATANQRVPTAAEVGAFHAVADGQNPHMAAVTGSFTGTTDEIIQWAAWKWGFDEDVVRAQAVRESRWHQSMVGDEGVSFGVMQVKSTIWRGTSPLSRDSTAFNLDAYGAIMRQCYDGRIAWLGGGYAAGDLWGCVGYYFTGRWNDPAGADYVEGVAAQLAARTWEAPGF